MMGKPRPCQQFQKHDSYSGLNYTRQAKGDLRICLSPWSRSSLAALTGCLAPLELAFFFGGSSLRERGTRGHFIPRGGQKPGIQECGAREDLETMMCPTLSSDAGWEPIMRGDHWLPGVSKVHPVFCAHRWLNLDVSRTSMKMKMREICHHIKKKRCVPPFSDQREISSVDSSEEG